MAGDVSLSYSFYSLDLTKPAVRCSAIFSFGGWSTVFFLSQLLFFIIPSFFWMLDRFFTIFFCDCFYVIFCELLWFSVILLDSHRFLKAFVDFRGFSLLVIDFLWLFDFHKWSLMHWFFYQLPSIFIHFHQIWSILVKFDADYPIRGVSGVYLASLWDPFGIPLGSLWDHF